MPTTHPVIDRLAEVGAEELSAMQVAHVLGRTHAYVYALIAANKLEAHADSARTGHANYIGERRLTYTISAAAVISYLIRTTSGDRVVLLEAIRERMPQHHKLAKGIAAKAPSPVAEDVPTLPPARKHGVKLITVTQRPKDIQLPLF